MALALANHRRWETESAGPMIPLSPPGRFSPFAKRPRALLGGACSFAKYPVLWQSFKKRKLPHKQFSHDNNEYDCQK